MFVTDLQTVQEGIRFIVIQNFKNHRTTDFVPRVLFGWRNLVRLKSPMASYGHNLEQCHSPDCPKKCSFHFIYLRENYAIPPDNADSAAEQSWENKSWEWLFSTAL